MPGSAVCSIRAATLTGVAHGRILNPQVGADFAHHHQPCVDADAHVQVEAALLEYLLAV